MKTSKKLKALTLILVIILITILSFLGVYNITKVHGDNLVKDYTVGMELKGKKILRLKVDDTVNEVTYDSEGNVVEEQDDEGQYTVVNEPVNAPEVLNKENYKQSMKIIENRLSSMDAEEYKTRFNEENGTIELEMIDNDLTDYIIETLGRKGNFNVVDNETGEILLDNTFVKNARVIYSSTDATSTTVYLDIEFNKDGAAKLEELSKIYVSTTEQVVNDDGETEDKKVEKKIAVKIDDTTIISTSFGEPLTTGHLYISVGQPSSISTDLAGYALQASVYASIIKSGPTPVTYTIEQNEFVVTNINKTIIPTVAIIALVVEIIILIVVFKLKGIIAAILQIGYVSLLLLILKYTNVYITIEGIFALVLIGILNMSFIYRTLQAVKSGDTAQKAINDTLVRFINISIPLLIVAIVFCFVNFLEINSFGMVIFWGYVVSLLYNIVFTKGILNNVL